MLHQLKQNTIVVLLAITLALAAQGSASAFSGGPEDGKTGAPGESTCQSGCHNSFPLNSGTGSLTLTGVPVSYTPGQTYTITVNLSQSGQSRWGFEVTVLDANNNGVGTLNVTDATHTRNPHLAGDNISSIQVQEHSTEPPTLPRVGPFRGQLRLRWSVP